MNYILSKHAKERYFERFGAQDEKTILDRCEKATTFFEDTHEKIIKRRYGAIVFVIDTFNKNLIKTITK